MDLGIWDGAAVLVKAALYAATLGAAGGVFFLAYTRSLSTLGTGRDRATSLHSRRGGHRGERGAGAAYRGLHG